MNLNGGRANGTVFQLTPAGQFTVLHTFTGSDGAGPVGLIRATDGNLYGATESGGTNNLGTTFQISTGGTFVKLHDFSGGASDGSQPLGGLMQKTDGNIYGTTSTGGNINTPESLGTVFRIKTGLSPFVKLLPALGNAGSVISVYGPNLAGATSLTFNGVPATITQASSTLIYTSLPAGATSGPIKVATPSGTFTSNVHFTVLP